MSGVNWPRSPWAAKAPAATASAPLTAAMPSHKRMSLRIEADGTVTTEFIAASDGVALAFERAGVKGGPPVMLVHGFGSSRGQNWKSTGWYSSLTEAGFSITAMDCRGHGESGKPHDPASYGHARMAADVIAVMDAAGLDRVFLCGYSM